MIENDQNPDIQILDNSVHRNFYFSCFFLVLPIVVNVASRGAELEICHDKSKVDKSHTNTVIGPNFLHFPSLLYYT